MSKTMNQTTVSTEERIKEAATKVFLEKGFAGTTTRDIAREAGLNSALMNYYFRSKEKLFGAVLNDMMALFFQGMYDIINKPIGLREKIAAMIEHDFQMFKANTSLSIFILNEVNRGTCGFPNGFPSEAIIMKSLFAEQLKKGIEAGEVRPIDIKSVFLLMIANIQFIFQSKVMTTTIYQMTEDEYDRFTEEHKNVVIDMVTGYLFLPKSEP